MRLDQVENPRGDAVLTYTQATVEGASSRIARSDQNLKREDAADPRVLRARLILEEVSEVLEALLAKDEVKLADSLWDSIYVLIGTCIAFDLPYVTGMREVQRSNMSKTTAIGGADNPKEDRGKGPDYFPPDVESIIREWRER